MSYDELRRDLEAASSGATRTLEARHRRRTLPRMIEEGAPLFLIGPVGILFVTVARRLGDGPTERVNPWILILWTILPPLAWFAVRFLFASQRVFAKRDALATLDRELELSDRLTTADEFLESNRTSDGFVAAAIEDATEHARRARAAELAREAEVAPVATKTWLWPGIACVLGVLALLLGPTEGRPLDRFVDDAEVATGVPVIANEADADEEDPARNEPRVEAPEEEERERRSSSSEATASERYSGELPDETKEGRGKTVAGQSSEAQSGQSASNSKGQTSTQTQTDKGSQKPRSSKKKKDSKSREAKDDPPNEKKMQEPSGSTAGRGTGSGSNKNPASTDWSSKDNVESFDDEPVEDDEEVDDEESDSDARGGMQPSLRDRRPPVSRDLQIGFGNQPNPDANGRGGPSQQKKSRGVASLVLGVPIPDNVKGRPNPGKTKITQERIEPQKEETTPIQASNRPEREGPVGHLARRPMKSWMRDVVRSYFLKIRQTEEG